MNGRKDVLGMYAGENESTKFWLPIMNGLKNRGVKDILIMCVDGLGLPTGDISSASFTRSETS